MLLNDLMSSPDGLRFLQEDEFLDQLVKSFAQLDPVSDQLRRAQLGLIMYTSSVQWYTHQ